mmetsp:Transcript_21634/g.31984  ORF Transcript_21634/g.31984 Transcript_21634/m.31984 type:complete len:606 (+) Transcript_21634:161-1978(+)|eukprot:CAMPEP_0194214366 /NCGR_PEP_ID=MMETSP0156-20130528/15509_1 /TAXON_ID=33649 /ORGANISM="Thalassionema nitzschioides, Strain L26-B" /LENGTH=605 /DNA_ID=CAMNT_0038942599 /DNA_START=91 /DNA_END=1908 /DNA_ORIENTATION=+
MLSSSTRIILKQASRTAIRSLSSRVATSNFPSLVKVSLITIPQTRTKSTLPTDFHEPRDDYQASQTFEGTDACLKAKISSLGITGPSTIHRNLTFQELFEHEQANNEGLVASAEYGDTFAVDTGKFTGRSPKDKFSVRNVGSESDKNIDWNDINQPTSPEVFEELYNRAVAHFNTVDKAYVFDGFCGANPKSQKKVRFVHEMAWQQHFVTNMFIRPETDADLEDFEPDFTIINCCSQVVEDWERLGLNSDTAVVFNIEKKTAVIFGTWYGGENKKGIFSLMNYWLPMNGDFSMHCSANVGKNGDSTLFFGLSGTGKTTLSADPERALIGDDEHGWDDDGIFNFEGGCYAKTINLSEATEPDIYRAIKTDALLENVKLDEGSKIPDYSDVSKTQNGRVSYPIFHIPNYHKDQMAGHPNNIIFLSCDAFGVLPPIAKLSSGQAMYHFISGYTAKVAGTERGIKEPVATFSACFGAAFLPLHPTRYADLLQEKLEKHGSSAFLVNSGWSGGPYGEGDRMSIKATRACVDAIVSGSIHDAEFATDPIFGFEVPTSIPGVEPQLLNPKSTWEDQDAYDKKSKELATMYIKNFEKYEGQGSVDYTKFGPKI